MNERLGNFLTIKIIEYFDETILTCMEIEILRFFISSDIEKIFDKIKIDSSNYTRYLPLKHS